MSKYLARLKTEKQAKDILTKPTKPSFGSFVSTHGECFQKKAAIGFDSKHWQHEIESAVNRAVERDQGALEYCQVHQPKLWTDCMVASKALDDVWRTMDGNEVRGAIVAYDGAARATREAAKNAPILADQLSQGEVNRFCVVHMGIKGKECQYKDQQEGCVMLKAKIKQMPIDRLPVSPECFVDPYNLNR